MSTVRTTSTTQTVTVEGGPELEQQLAVTGGDNGQLVITDGTAANAVTVDSVPERLIIDEGQATRQTVVVAEEEVQVVTIGVPGPPGGLGPLRSQTLAWASTVTVDWSTVDVVRLTLTGATTLVFQGAVNDQRVLLELTQGGLGGHTVTWPTTLRYPLTIPSLQLSTTPGALDRIGFLYRATTDTYDVAAIALGY